MNYKVTYYRGVLTPIQPIDTMSSAQEDLKPFLYIMFILIMSMFGG